MHPEGIAASCHGDKYARLSLQTFKIDRYFTSLVPRFTQKNAWERQCLSEYFDFKSLKKPIVCGIVGKIALSTVTPRRYYPKKAHGILKRGAYVM